MSKPLETELKKHSVVSFWGGNDRGQMVQITCMIPLGEVKPPADEEGFIILNKTEAAQLVSTLQRWLESFEPGDITPAMRYITSDGETHHSMGSAESHLKRMKQTDKKNRMLQEGYSLGDIIRATGGEPEDPILDEITKDSQLVISHWQCSEKPGYQVSRFHINGTIFVHGNVGSWSGPYGNWLRLAEVIGHAKHKGSILDPQP